MKTQQAFELLQRTTRGNAWRARLWPLLSTASALALVGITIIASSENSNSTSYIENYYPQAAHSRIDNCLLCHEANWVDLNPYGADWHFIARMNFYMINDIDSDGDRYTNLEEFNAITYPGFADDNPSSPTYVPPTTTTTTTISLTTTTLVIKRPLFIPLLKR